MATTRKDIAIPQSGTYRLVMTVVGGPDDLVGATCRMQIKTSKASNATTLATIETDSFTIDDLNFQVVLEITDEQTSTFNWSKPAVYDIYLTDAQDKRWRLLEGVAILSKTVTQEA
jgi:hypothetical protein